jgi:hypothetical protein
MNFFLDDLRNPNDAYLHLNDTCCKTSLVDHSGIHENDWVVVRTYDEFVKCITYLGLPDVVSFDHDLHDEHIEHYFMVTQDIGIVEYGNLKEKTGKHCAEYLVQEWKKQGKTKPIKTFVHSANKWGGKNIKEVLQQLN